MIATGRPEDEFSRDPNNRARSESVVIPQPKVATSSAPPPPKGPNKNNNKLTSKEQGSTGLRKDHRNGLQWRKD